MMKRVTWWLAGVVIGAGGSGWLRRRVRRRIAETPVARAVGTARSLPATVSTALRGAIDEGRNAAHARERELRAEHRLGTAGPMGRDEPSDGSSRQIERPTASQ
jgi:hypothetical protein